MSVSRVLAVLCLAPAACAPPVIVVPDEASVAATPRTARAVELCVLMQETDVRPMYQGVAEFSSATWHYAIASIAVKHPDGLLIIDPAFGLHVGDELLRAGPIVTGVMGTGRTKTPLVEVMRRAGMDPEEVRFAALTHAHWDHTGALGDLPHARVLTTKTELAWLKPFIEFFDGGAMPHHLKKAKRRLVGFDFTGPAIDGFSGSFDVFHDGSVVAVPLPGHTPGSTGYLVRGTDGHTYLFSGDATWTSRGVELPAHKMLQAFDSDLDQLSATIGRLHAFSLHRPDVRVVPAHDGAALANLPACGSAKAQFQP